jgi:hypothetical protein
MLVASSVSLLLGFGHLDHHGHHDDGHLDPHLGRHDAGARVALDRALEQIVAPLPSPG